MSRNRSAYKVKGAIRSYLEALETHRPKRGRKRTAETVERQFLETRDRLDTASALDRVTLLQKKMDLEGELASLQGADGYDMEALEAGFVASAAAYSERKGISYADWREAGVAAGVVRAASMSRGGCGICTPASSEAGASA